MDAGDTLGLPDPTKVPEQLPLYQFHDAPVPSEPPDRLNVVAPPQVGLVDAEAPVGAVELVFIVTAALPCVPQHPPADLDLK